MEQITQYKKTKMLYHAQALNSFPVTKNFVYYTYSQIQL